MKLVGEYEISADVLAPQAVACIEKITLSPRFEEAVIRLNLWGSEAARQHGEEPINVIDVRILRTDEYREHFQSYIRGTQHPSKPLLEAALRVARDQQPDLSNMDFITD